MITYFHHRRFTLLSIIALATLAACAQNPGKNPQPAMIQPPGENPELRRIVDFLEKGDEKAARKALKAASKRNPADAAVMRLLDSLSADPVASLGSKNFDYLVQPGDRMTDLAQRFLGDRLKFYILARYNGIVVPASIQPGQTVRIPGNAPPTPPVIPTHVTRPEQPKRSTSTRPASTAKPVTRASKIDPAQAAKLRGDGLAALNQGQVARAVILLHQAAALDPANPLIKRDLERAQRIRKTVKAKR